MATLSFYLVVVAGVALATAFALLITHLVLLVSNDRDVLDRAFGRLTVEQRAILVLHHLEQRPLSAIAAALAIPVGTAKSRLHAARAAVLARGGDDVAAVTALVVDARDASGLPVRIDFPFRLSRDLNSTL